MSLSIEWADLQGFMWPHWPIRYGWSQCRKDFAGVHWWDPSPALPSSQELQGTARSSLSWGRILEGCLGGSWELLCYILVVPFPGQLLSDLTEGLAHTGCRTLNPGLALLQDDDSRDRVSTVLRAAAGIQGAEALVGCVHGLSLRRHAHDRCVWVHATGKSIRTDARRVFLGWGYKWVRKEDVTAWFISWAHCEQSKDLLVPGLKLFR